MMMKKKPELPNETLIDIVAHYHTNATNNKDKIIEKEENEDSKKDKSNDNGTNSDENNDNDSDEESNHTMDEEYEVEYIVKHRKTKKNSQMPK